MIILIIVFVKYAVITFDALTVVVGSEPSPKTFSYPQSFSLNRQNKRIRRQLTNPSSHGKWPFKRCAFVCNLVC